MKKYVLLSFILFVNPIIAMEPTNDKNKEELIITLKNKLKELEDRLAKYDHEIRNANTAAQEPPQVITVSQQASTPITREQNQIYKEMLAKLEMRIEEYDKKIKKFEEKLGQQITTPDAPPLIASAKLPAPPTPEQPQKSFLEKHKKAIIVGSIGAGVLTASGILWKLNSQVSSKDYYIEQAR